MKRTKKINYATFRKSWRIRSLTPIALAITTVFMLAGCEQADETVSMYQNSDDCSQANPGKSEHCTTAYHHAQQEAAKTAPKFASREDCVAEFGENQCQQTPAQANVAASPSQSSTSFWMPMMAGYMMGRMMGGGSSFISQPLFTSNNPASPANGKYVDASGRSYGTATPGRRMSVPQKALAPKPATTQTTVRGGFGETVTKHSLSSSSRSHASSSSAHRSFGG